MPRSKSKSDIILIDTSKRWFNLTLIIICFFSLLGIRLYVDHANTGDEPHYLVEIYSLVHDGDLSLANNYDNKDYVTLGYPSDPPLEPQGTANVAPEYAEKDYSSHGKGLSYLLAPGFFIAGKAGAILSLVLVAVAVVVLTWRRTMQVTGNRYVSYLTAAALSICYFFNASVGTVYPDILIGGITLATLILLDKKYVETRYQIVIGFLLGFLIVTHLKASVIAAPALGVLVYNLWVKQRKLPWTSIMIVAAFIAYYFLTLNMWFGTFNLSEIQHGQPFDANPFQNIPAMLFDVNRSLFVYNPITILIILGLPIWYKLNRQSLIETLVVILPTAAMLAIIPNWNGSAAPTGRYLMELLPAIMPAIGFALIALKRTWQRVVVGILAALTFLVGLNAAIYRIPYINGDLEAPKSVLFQQIEANFGIQLNRLLPTFSNYTNLVGPRDWIKVLYLTIIVCIIFVYGIRLAASLDPDKDSKGKR